MSVNWFDRMAWDLICSKIAEKQRLNNYMTRDLICSKIAAKGFTPTAKTRRLLTFGGRGCGKTIAMKTVLNQIYGLYNKSVISVRWCESFEIFDDRKRRVCFVHLAKI